MKLETVTMRLSCENDECGMWSFYRFWRGGDFQRVFEACWHPKRWPPNDQIEAEFKRKESEAAE